ncbi:MAG: hypothetical protein AAFV88_14700 [Planctomycetota bacterium]
MNSVTRLKYPSPRLFLMLVALIAVSADHCAGAPQDLDPTVVSDSVSSTPWYDAETRSLTPMELQRRVDDSVHRESRWLPRPEVIAKKRTPNSNGRATNNGFGLFGSSLTLGHLLGWCLLIAFVMAVVGAIIYGISRAELRLSAVPPKQPVSASDSKLPDKATLERIKHLPPELRRTDVNLRTECERLMSESQFDQAIILLLGHQLLLLDQNGLLRLGRGKTNGRYVRETRMNDEACAAWLRQTADAFEQSYFGRHTISSDVFDLLWRNNQQMEQVVQEHGAKP